MTREEAIDYIVNNHLKLICPIIKGLCYDDCEVDGMKLVFWTPTHEVAQEIQVALKLGAASHTPNSIGGAWRWSVHGEQARAIGPELASKLRKKGTMEAHRRANFIEIALGR